MFPSVPDSIKDSGECVFAPAPEILEWAQRFFDPKDPLYNDDHAHLVDDEASILFVWSSENFKRRGSVVVGTAQLGQQQGSLGKRELLESIYREWNDGELPDFVITICAPYVMEASPAAICALVEHELYHCSYQRDRYGDEVRKRDGSLIWALRGHDVEEFTGVVRRYGATSPELAAMAKHIQAGPAVSPVESDRAVCGCGAAVGVV